MKVFTVSEFTKSVKSLIEGAFPETVVITGEVSNLSRASSGHIYFTLKDGGGQVRAAFFKRYLMGPSVFAPKNGDKVRAVGDIVLYEPDGSYQLIVKRVFYSSEGDFWKKFEETKRKLEAEGLFDEDRKKEIPKLPFRAALITSISGAAIKDFITTAQREGGRFRMEAWGVPVQGAEAGAKIAGAIALAGAMTDRYDVLVLMRGGGSLEDLSVFNSEEVARAVAASMVPVISAVGHERDVTVADFACDKRAATPTAAAVILSAGFREAARVAEDLETRTMEAIIRIVQNLYQRLDYIELRLGAVSPRAVVRSYGGRLALVRSAIVFNMKERLSRLNSALERSVSAIGSRSPGNAAASLEFKRAGLEKSLKNAAVAGLSRCRSFLEGAEEKLKLLNPENVLERGYAIVMKDGFPVISVTMVEEKEDIEIKLKDGYINSFVTNIIKPEADNG